MRVASLFWPGTRSVRPDHNNKTRFLDAGANRKNRWSLVIKPDGKVLLGLRAPTKKGLA